MTTGQYNLSEAELWEIKRVSERRAKTKFSLGLSAEGQLAMKLAREDTKLMPNGLTSDDELANYQLESDKNINERNRKRNMKHLKFADMYEQNSSARFDGDITGDDFPVQPEVNITISTGPVTGTIESIEMANFEGEIETEVCENSTLR